MDCCCLLHFDNKHFNCFAEIEIYLMAFSVELTYRILGAVSVACSGAVVLTGLVFPNVMINPKRVFPHMLFLISVCDMIGNHIYAKAFFLLESNILSDDCGQIDI